MISKRIAIAGIPGSWSTEALARAFRERTDFSVVVDLGQVSVDLEQHSASYGDLDLCQFDAVVVKKVDVQYEPKSLDRVELLRYLECRGVRCFSKARAIYGLIDRLSCTLSLRAAGVVMPPTVVTESVDQACNAVERLGAAVFKPLYSTKARGMVIIEAGPDMRSQIEAFQHAGNPMMYLQQKLDLGDRDYGMAYVGGKYLATYARVKSTAAWNTTIHSGGHYAPHEPSAQMLALADKAQAVFGLDFTTVDVVDTATGPMVLEVSAFGGFRGLREACGVDAAAHYADHVISELQ